MTEWATILSPFMIYIFATLTPGPANITIMQVALEQGRKNAIACAIGVVVGSISWAIVTLSGISQIIYRFPNLIKTLGWVGSTYMLWLGYSNIRKSFYANINPNRQNHLHKIITVRKNFLRGVLIHLTNVKAFLVWTAILLAALDGQAKLLLPPYLIVLGCGVIGVIVFCGYAVLFSHDKSTEIYRQASKTIYLIIGLAFIVASIQIFMVTMNG